MTVKEVIQRRREKLGKRKEGKRGEVIADVDLHVRKEKRS